ncbi:ABC transporter permease (plasmid) [Rhizobium ruizarguesonis]|uniref:Polyamine ABC transporter permease n=2 Tax=Rhizobium TaxID=379 RepID=A0A179BIF1_RHILE|nr:ABC transporter permease [Rhizobium leguminosarum]OAP91119.1 polyamine ABC transporter permease [Rhizobium leguminosarum]
MWIKAAKLVFSPLAILFLVAPLIAILPLAFTSSVILTYPVPSYSLRWFEELLSADTWRRSIINSLMIGSGTTLLATLLGMAASLGLRDRTLLLRGTFRTLFLLPMVVPAVVLGVGMQVLLARLGLTNSYVGVIIAHTVVAVPFVVISISGALSGIDGRTELAAQSLGASPWIVFRRVTLPLAMPGILSGAVLAFATSLDEVVLTLFVAGPNQRTLAREMFSSIRENVSPTIAAAAFLFIAATVAVGLSLVLLRSLRTDARQG